jgi:hypothetical protein
VQAIVLAPQLNARGQGASFSSQRGKVPDAFYIVNAEGGNQQVLLKDEPKVRGANPAWQLK